MEMQENSISIINRSGGTVTGENTGALPIKVVTGFNLTNKKIFFIGFATALLLFAVFAFTIQRQVVVVEVSGKAENYQEYKIN